MSGSGAGNGKRRSACVVRCVLFALWVLSASAQGQPPDFQTWHSITLRKDLSSRWRLQVEEELRLRDNSSRLRVLYTDAAARFRPADWVATAAHYRLLIRPSGISHRIYEETNFRWRPSDLDFGLRLRLQHEFRPGPDQTYIRTRIASGYRINKKWRPNINAEFFYHIFHFEGNEFDEIRLQAGTDWLINKDHTLKGHLQYEYEFNQAPPFRAICLVLSYEVDL
ncbi:MAG: DUF2490 domain-containing protein [Chitinophagales bacterium]|nr:DUF2490 domain-containing protein [Chitinophagales bacterium]MDW8394035.1 DUF2490 domain-containing protein [Chitinophagales bacterium]